MKVKNLSEIAITVSVKACAWLARKPSSDAVRALQADSGATENGDQTFTAYKRLFDSTLVKAVVKARNELYKVHRELTSPWANDGERLLKATSIDHYMKKINEVVAEYKATYERFLTHYSAFYDRLEVNGRARMGKYFDADDYITPGEARAKFKCEVNYGAIADLDAWKIGGLSQSQVQEIVNKVAERERNLLHDAMKDVWYRLYEKVKKMADTLSKEDAKFHGTLITNIADVCEILPLLNLQDDPKLEEMRQEVERRVTHFDPEVLREDKLARKDAADTAKDLADKINGYL